jgi:hypothetical protein
MDAPNVELILSEPVTLTATYRRQRSGSRVLLFVDEPDALVGALTATRPPAP